MRAEDFDIDKLVLYLQGTCKTTSEGINDLYPDMEEDDLTEEDVAHLDQEIFRCETCSWWCEISEMSEEDQTCTDCNDE